MGIEAEQFVHPERISSQLFCSICTNVLENPVITPSEHMFCESELLDWFVTKGDQICPMTNAKLDPSKIAKPGRIITNMLNELERYCTNKAEGCQWTGQNDQLKVHLKTCDFQPRAQMASEIKQQKTTIKLLTSRIEILETTVQDLQDQRDTLLTQVNSLKRTVRVYDAFMKQQVDVGDRELQLERLRGTLRAEIADYDDADDDEDGEDSSSLLLSAAPRNKLSSGGYSRKDKDSQDGRRHGLFEWDAKLNSSDELDEIRK